MAEDSVSCSRSRKPRTPARQAAMAREGSPVPAGVRMRTSKFPITDLSCSHTLGMRVVLPSQPSVGGQDIAFLAFPTLCGAPGTAFPRSVWERENKIGKRGNPLHRSLQTIPMGVIVNMDKNTYLRTI